MKRLDNEYGHRAKLAQSQEGIDWKALSHAVRVGRQAVELLETHNINFPLDYADHLKSIKLGELPYQQIAEEIEQLLDDVVYASEKSTLPDSCDKEWIDNFICDCYSEAVFSDYN